MDLLDFLHSIHIEDSPFDSVNVIKGESVGFKELVGKTIHYFNGIGIPKENISYATRYDTKTRTAYIDINGKYENKETGFCNDIEVSIPVDTNQYDSFKVEVTDGLITVTLVEIKSPNPTLRDLNKKL